MSEHVKDLAVILGRLLAALHADPNVDIDTKIAISEIGEGLMDLMIKMDKSEKEEFLDVTV